MCVCMRVGVCVFFSFSPVIAPLLSLLFLLLPLIFPSFSFSFTSRYPARARFDRARDRYITAKGYDILRLQLIGRSVDDLVNQINDRVVEKTEQQADREIQQIYAVDASSLYSPEAARKVYNPRKNVKTESSE